MRRNLNPPPLGADGCACGGISSSEIISVALFVCRTLTKNESGGFPSKQPAVSLMRFPSLFANGICGLTARMPNTGFDRKTSDSGFEQANNEIGLPDEVVPTTIGHETKRPYW